MATKKLECALRLRRELPKRLRAALGVRGINQARLVAATGISPASVNSLVLGYQLPSAAALVLLCQALEVSADYLLALTPEVELPAPGGGAS